MSSSDIEKGDDSSAHVVQVGVPVAALAKDEIVPERWDQRLLKAGVETRGMQPVPYEERTDPQWYKQFFHWFSADVNVLCFSTGGIATFGFGMSLKDAAWVILLFNLICSAPVGWAATIAPQTGLRQMVATRYSFGLWGTTLPVIFNLIVMFGYGVTNSIVGGQALAAVSYGNMSWVVGIVIVLLCSLVVSFCGIRVLSWYEKVAWAPALIAFLVFIGKNAGKLALQEARPAASAAQICGFGGIVAGFQLTWVAVAPDLCVYMKPSIKGLSWKIGLSVYAGLVIPVTTIMILGAAVGSADVPAWHEGKVNGQLNGLLRAMFDDMGHGGKFVILLLALSIIGNLSLSIYAKSLNLQFLIPQLVRVPRYLMSVLVIVITLPIAAAGAHHVYTALINFLSIVGYWGGAYAPIVMIEHFIFRKNDAANYNVDHWNSAKDLPTGIPAILAFASGWAIAIPCMDETWYTGPIAKHTGDIGFEMAFAVSGLVYVVGRAIEVKIRGRV